MTRRDVPMLWIAGGASLWMATAANLPLWRELYRLGLLAQPAGQAMALASVLLIACLLMVLLSLLAWRPVIKAVAFALLLVGAGSAYFMLSYGVVIDPGMMTNALQTDWRESTALLSPRMALTMLVLAGLPILVLARVRPRAVPWRRRLLRNVGCAIGFLLLAVALVLACFQPLSSTMRNHKHLRYLVNPLAAMYALGSIAAQPLKRPAAPLVVVGADAVAAAPGPRPPLLVLVVGETGRSGNFGLNGYARRTTPELEREGVASFRDAWSCGTSTAASLPCMFSPLGKAGFEDRHGDTENLLDVLKHAGLAVLWVDNQSGCKGVCDRVASVNVSESKDPELCAAGECLDGILLKDLDARLAALPAERRAKGAVLVLHQMGSHGPAYSQRSPREFKRFLPECTSADLQACGRDEIVNAYDNSIAYTDHVLAGTIGWLKTREQDWDTGLVYVADHGESLGENNLYLHGLPYALAPDVQKHVPWITWLSAGFQKRTGASMDCVRGQSGARLTHDHLFHSILGLAQVRTAAYRQSLDAYAPCTHR